MLHKLLVLGEAQFALQVAVLQHHQQEQGRNLSARLFISDRFFVSMHDSLCNRGHPGHRRGRQGEFVRPQEKLVTYSCVNSVFSADGGVVRGDDSTRNWEQIVSRKKQPDKSVQGHLRKKHLVCSYKLQHGVVHETHCREKAVLFGQRPVSDVGRLQEQLVDAHENSNQHQPVEGGRLRDQRTIGPYQLRETHHFAWRDANRAEIAQDHWETLFGARYGSRVGCIAKHAPSWRSLAQQHGPACVHLAPDFRRDEFEIGR